MEMMQSKGIAAGVVQNVKDLFNDPQLKEREHFVSLKQTDVGYRSYHNEPLKFSKTPPKFWKAGPNLGEDNHYVYKEILGYFARKDEHALKAMFIDQVDVHTDLPGQPIACAL
jgi:crotonobetainyl-CoA:carnitine CoA-transferase CaiB-like acyl-CoA transferase